MPWTERQRRPGFLTYMIEENKKHKKHRTSSQRNRFLSVQFNLVLKINDRIVNDRIVNNLIVPLT